LEKKKGGVYNIPE